MKKGFQIRKAENEGWKTLWGFTIQTDKIIEHIQSGNVYIEKK